MDISARPRRPDKAIYKPRTFQKTDETKSIQCMALHYELQTIDEDNTPKSSGDTAKESTLKQQGFDITHSQSNTYLKSQIESQDYTIDTDVQIRTPTNRFKGSATHENFNRIKEIKKNPNNKNNLPVKESQLLTPDRRVKNHSNNATPLPISITSNFSKNDSDKLDSIKNENPRHGGIIHLPKNISLHNKNEEPKDKFAMRGSRGYNSSKPTVVVNPNIYSNITADSHARSNMNTYSNMSQQPFNQNGSFESKHFSSGKSGYNTESDQSKPNFSSSNNYQSACLNINQSVPFGSMQLSGKAPNPIVAETLMQVIQMDEALSTLMIPPGRIASKLPPLIEEQSAASSDTLLTEPEKLFMRWWQTVQQLRNTQVLAFERIILEDLDFCNSACVEQGMWKSAFYTILESLRAWLANPYKTGLLPRPDESDRAESADTCARLLRLIRQVCVEDVIGAGERQITSLLHRIQQVRRICLDYVITDGRPPPETGSRTRCLVYLSAQKLMLFLGDLARYEEIVTGGQNFGKARRWYQQAQLLIPKNGRPYNQLAVLAVYTGRHFDAMCYYIRSLAASNPFPTASQSLAALFHEIHLRGVDLMRDTETNSRWKNQQAMSTAAQVSSHISHMFSHGRSKRVEIWIHPVDGSATIVQGNRSLVIPNSDREKAPKTRRIEEAGANEDDDNEDDEEEEAQAEAEEYANMSLIELTKRFGLHFMHAHGQLFTKIGMESFPEVASLALQAFSGLLAQRPCPLSSDRICQILMVNMFNVDRAAVFTAQSTAAMAAAAQDANSSSGAGTASKARRGKNHQKASSSNARLDPGETLRSVHHDHAARLALDTFSLICRRAAKLLSESKCETSSENLWLPTDLRLLLPSLRLWSEWMILHPEHWTPPPNHRDPTLRPYLEDWRLVADLCTRASNWLSRVSHPEVTEIDPTTPLVVRLHLQKKWQENIKSENSANEDISSGGDIEDDSVESTEISPDIKFTYLFEETLFAGFKPMLDLIPKMYQFTGEYLPESVSDFIRMEKIVLFGDFLCGIEPPCLAYNIDAGVYESVMERESGEQSQDQSRPEAVSGRPSLDSEDGPSSPLSPSGTITEEKEEIFCTGEDEVDEDIQALRRQRTELEIQAAETRRLEAWRAQAVRQAAAGGPRGVEVEVRPIYILPDTNCYIDWLDGVACFAQPSSNYTVLVPIIVLYELDCLATQDRSMGLHSIESAFAQYLTSSSSGNTPGHSPDSSTRASLIQERAKAAIAYLECEFDRRNPRLRALTSRGSMLETIAYRNEANRGRQPGQVNDDVILTCCRQFCKEALSHMSAEGLLGPMAPVDAKNQPMRLTREVVLLTSDRNLRLKALSVNIPARPLRSFVQWANLPTRPSGSIAPSLSSKAGKISACNTATNLTTHGRWDRRGKK